MVLCLAVYAQNISIFIVYGQIPIKYFGTIPIIKFVDFLNIRHVGQ